MTVRKIKSIGDIPYPIDVGADALSPLLTAGAALGITGNDAEESAWFQRVSTSDGPTTIKSIHGRTLVWNQMASLTSRTDTSNGVTFVRSTDGTVTANGTASGDSGYVAQPFSAVQGHKYLIKGCPAGGSTTTYRSHLTGSAFSTSVADYGNGGIGAASSTDTAYYVLANVYNGTTVTNLVFRPQLFDLTAMFGAGNEPSTVAEFEALFPEPYYAYDAGSLLSVNMEGIATEDADGNPLQSRSILAGTLRSAGTVYDEQTATERITRIGERAYQSGDESDSTVVTDGTVTHYALSTPTTVEIDPPLNLTYRTETGGTERVMVPTGELSAPPTIVTAQGYTAESLRDAALATIAPVENGLASTNYAVGSYLVHGGQLCKVTTAIATGEAITIGTNVTATTVMAEILSLVQ